MIIDIYVNKSKDPNNIWVNKMISLAKSKDISYRLISDSDLNSKTTSDALFVIGGDGTILNLTTYASNNRIPIVGFNAGKLGFLTEFEMDEIDEAFTMFKNSMLKKDVRTIISASLNGNKFLALNDVVLQRISIEERGNNIVSLDVFIDDNQVDKIIGDGVIISTPTGTTAYSLSAGGAILAPGINAFSVTPIAAHSFNQRPIVYSAQTKSLIKNVGDCKTGLFIDGIFATSVQKDDVVEMTASDLPIIFLRKEGFNFYKRLSKKLKDRNGVNYD